LKIAIQPDEFNKFLSLFQFASYFREMIQRHMDNAQNEINKIAAKIAERVDVLNKEIEAFMSRF
jgi:hypothetical protein